MTTAAKPTFNPARGGTGRTESDLGALSKQYSSRDLPSHTKLKYRQEGQGTSGEMKTKDFKRELEEKERAIRDKKNLGINNNAKTAALKGGNNGALIVLYLLLLYIYLFIYYYYILVIIIIKELILILLF